MDVFRQDYSSRYIGNKNIMNEMETLAKGVGKQMGKSKDAVQEI